MGFVAELELSVRSSGMGEAHGSGRVYHIPKVGLSRIDVNLSFRRRWFERRPSKMLSIRLNDY
jgi:hypothetical protein